MFIVGIIGENGQLGRQLIRRSPGGEIDTEAFVRGDLDITDAEMVKQCLRDRSLDLIVNAAAYTAVDQAENDALRAHAVNADGPGNLAAACSLKGIPLIHVSTDYVFDGAQTTPYCESDAPSPLGVYGKSKARGEQNVRKHLSSHIIVRTSWLYSATGHNFVKTMLRLGREKSVLKVVADQHGCPTSAADLADAIWQIIAIVRRNDPCCWGTYHFCNRGETTWYGLAKALFACVPKYPDYDLQLKQLLPIPSAEYPTPARRPLYSVLNCDLIQKTFQIDRREWQVALQDTMDDLFARPMKDRL
jgi:dTDP-4-dehydrorhamnose reductase